MATLEPVAPPDDTYIHARWIAADRVRWVKDADDVLNQYNLVNGTRVYSKKHQAIWQARQLIHYMTELRLHERWELIGRVNRVENGYTWSVQKVTRGEHARGEANRRRASRGRAEGAEGRQGRR